MDGPRRHIGSLSLVRCAAQLARAGGLALGLVLALLGGSERANAAAPSALPAPELIALIRDRALNEISGIAVSARHADTFWVHNDSGNGPYLHAIDRRGRRLATLHIEGVAARDFEDMAAFELDGRRYLMIADTGDNGGVRTELELVVVEEPAVLADARVRPAWTQRFRWPDGARDVEAVAVDTQAREVLLVSKKRVPPELLRLPLGASAELQTAASVATLPGIAPPTEAELAGNPRFGRYRAQITAGDLSSDGLQLAVLSYRRAYVYRRARGEGWASALTRRPIELRFGWAAQAEALAFDPDDNALWISGERLPAPLIRVPLPQR